jgi:RNA polymerase sigma factor (sigma-70 family)
MAAMEADLVRAAQHGDAAALGAVLTRHEAAMRAVALGILGHGPDADQDAMLTAVRRIGEVRDPLAVGAWLRSIVRNNCRALFRRPAPPALPIDGGVTPEEVLEKHALRDWVWHAIGELSEADRLVTLLRHFSGVTAYDQIAALCGLPAGAVRSRLSHARRGLADKLRRDHRPGSLLRRLRRPAIRSAAPGPGRRARPLRHVASDRAGLAEYPARYPDVPGTAAVPAAFQQAITAEYDEALSAALCAAIPVYFADYWARRADFRRFTDNVRAWAAPASAQDPVPYDVAPRLGEISAPTAVVAGAHDFICGPRWARMLADGIPGARLTVLEDSGHFGHVEQPAEFAEAVVSALLP